MKTNAQLKQEAKEVLAGRWKDAVLMNLIPAAIQILAILVIFLVIAIPAFFLWNTNTVQNVIQNGEVTQNIDLNLGSQGGSGLFGGIIGTFFAVGISWTFLDLLRGSKTSITPLKDALRGFQAPYGIGILVIYLLSSIFTFFWSLLFVIPGIIKSYSYSQAYFIYYDEYRQTGVPPRYLDSITKSRRLMDGNKGRLFLLDLSFIGWHFVALLTLGIGYLWLMPYISATKAAFYADLAQNN
ncbi:DUF975 family protein [Enterococcus lemanii]|uniref:DUF975 family protein n=1 Tax=Enterococcus lemanii TaxID=1159752 RepID=A0ABV9MW17_9ENTE|nr:DUF975 family protein [Enterococcus lemanii]MBM7709528.1 putative membrane protein [Enterococcus lemanii]NLM66325.1 DUF975 family protein [Enterococcus sp.]